MARPRRRIEELVEQGAVERQQLASAVRVTADAARSTAARVGPVVKTAGAGVAIAGFGLAIAAVIRGIRARSRPRSAWKRLRRAFEDFRPVKRKPRPFRATLLLALARSKTARRVIAAAVQQAAQNRSAGRAETDHDASNGAVRASWLSSRGAPEANSAAPERGAGAKIPPPPVPEE